MRKILIRDISIIISACLIYLGYVGYVVAAGFFRQPIPMAIFSRPVAGPSAPFRVTIPTGAIAVWAMNEGGGTSTFEYYYSTRTGTLIGDGTTTTWNSTGGARGYAAISNKPTTGYVSVPNDPSWMSLEQGGPGVGMQTWAACIEPRSLGAQARGYISHEDNSGTKYEYVIFRDAADKVNSRLSNSAGGGISTLLSTAGVLNIGQRNTIVARVDRTVGAGSWTRMWINTNLTGTNSTDGAGTVTNASVDLRFGLQGADPTAYSDTNMSFFMYFQRNLTDAEISTFNGDCNTLSAN